MKEKKELIEYYITFGLGGGYGVETEVIEACSEEEANKEAYYKAKESYEQYEGCGVSSIHDIINDNDLDEVEDESYAYEMYNEEIENSIEYSATPYIPEKHDDYLY